MAHIENAALRGGNDVWFHKGYSGRGNVQPLLDTLSGRTALVCGSGRGVFEEVIQLQNQIENPVVFACNDVGMYLHHVDHFVSLHASKLDLWADLRRDPTSKGTGGNKDFYCHDPGLHGPRDWFQWKGLTPLMSFSGMFAAQIAFLMGCSRIILCGIPQDETPRFFEAVGRKDRAYINGQGQIKAEAAFKPELKAAIRSMSGWTREFFGGV